MTKQTSSRYRVTEEERPLQLLKLIVALLLLLAILGLLLWALSTIARPPILLYPHPGDRLAANPLTVSGSGMPGAQVELVIDGRSRGTTPVNRDGGWALTTDLNGPGEHWVHAQVLNRWGVVVAASAPLQFFLDEPAAPTPPTVVPSPNPPTTTNHPAQGPVVISNTVAPVIVVEVKVDGPPAVCAYCPKMPTPTVTPRPTLTSTLTPTPTFTPTVPPPPVTPCPTKPGWYPTATPPPNSCPATRPSGETYRVVRGDTLSSIAARFGVSVRALLAVNPQIRNPNRLYVGEVLHLPRR